MTSLTTTTGTPLATMTSGLVRHAHPALAAGPTSTMLSMTAPRRRGTAHSLILAPRWHQETPIHTTTATLSLMQDLQHGEPPHHATTPTLPLGLPIAQLDKPT